MSKRVAAWCRVSTEKQEKEGASLRAQEAMFDKWVAADGGTVAKKFIVQETATKGMNERPVFQELVAMINAR